MAILHLDFETFSACELKDAGLDNYAKHPSTGVHCVAFAFDDEPVGLWTPPIGAPLQIFSHVVNGGLVYAHNVAFELAIWNYVMAPRYGWPELKPEQCRCTMAMAYAMGLPGALENAAPALGITQRKDALGKRIMLKYCRPKADGTFWKPEDDPAQFQALCDYCKQDVVVERALAQRLMELSPTELEVWQLDYQINQRGILVDLPAIDKAIALVVQEKKRLDAQMLRVTSGVVGACTEVQMLVKWIRAQGVDVPGLAKADVLDALGGDLPELVREALELRKEAAKSSTAKLVAMKNRASLDGRVRGTKQYHGANTGRWAGRGMQTDNYPRPRPGIKPPHIEDILQHLADRNYIDMMYGPVLDALADCLRGMIIAPKGKELIASDFSNVEGRTLAWLAGEEWKLQAFEAFDRGTGEDIYKLTYARSFGIPVAQVTKDQRQVGKVEELALGYGGGVGAFQSMARNYDVHIADDDANQIKIAWRQAHPRITAYWYALENAAMEALRSKAAVTVGPKGREVAFRKAGSFLWCKLPSGRVLCYPYPEIRTVTTPWGDEKEALTYMTVVADPKSKTLPDEASSGNWKRISTYGGSLAENVTQAVARDLLAAAMLRLAQQGAMITAHVHDEVILEIDQASGPDTVKRVCALMAVAPPWAVGLPLAAEGWRGKRYRK